MKRKKLYLITAIVSASTIFHGISGTADNTITVKLNGNKINFDQPPIIYNERTLVPMRAIFEAMGCEVEWDDGVIDVYKDDENIMTLWVNDYEMWLPSGLVTLDVAPMVINDRTLVPVRAITESMGADVNWNGNSKTVSISYSEKSSNSDICIHSNTREVVMIDLTKYENIGSAEEHKATETIEIICNACDETVSRKEQTKYKQHLFSNNECIDCGYKLTKTENTDSNIEEDYEFSDDEDVTISDETDSSDIEEILSNNDIIEF